MTIRVSFITIVAPLTTFIAKGGTVDLPLSKPFSGIAPGTVEGGLVRWVAMSDRDAAAVAHALGNLGLVGGLDTPEFVVIDMMLGSEASPSWLEIEHRGFGEIHIKLA